MLVLVQQFPINRVLVLLLLVVIALVLVLLLVVALLPVLLLAHLKIYGSDLIRLKLLLAGQLFSSLASHPVERGTLLQ